MKSFPKIRIAYFRSIKARNKALEQTLTLEIYVPLVGVAGFPKSKEDPFFLFVANSAKDVKTVLDLKAMSVGDFCLGIPM